MCDGEPVLSTEHVTHLCGGWKPSDAQINALPGAPFTATESVIISIAWQGVRLSPESVLPVLEFLIAREKERAIPHSSCAGQGPFGEKSA